MQTTAQPNSMPIANAKAGSQPWLMLISRPVLFILFQGLIALIFVVTGTTLAQAWNESARWWTFTAFLANFASLYLLIHLYRAEGKRFFDIL